MSTRGRPGRGGASLVHDVSELGLMPEQLANGLLQAADERRAAEADRVLQEMRAAFDAERAALQAKLRSAENYAIEVSERLIDARAAALMRTERARAERAAAAQEITRVKSKVNALAEKFTAELAQERKRGGEAEKTAGEIAAKLDAAEAALQAAEAQRVRIERRFHETDNAGKAIRAELEELRRQAESAKRQIEQLRSSIRFQLGHALIEAGATWRGAWGLPAALMGLMREVRRRKQRQRVGGTTRRSTEERRDLDPPEATSRTLKALSILDEISEASRGAELKLFRLTRERWQQQIDGSSSDFAFLESCWKGDGGAWEYAFTSPEMRHANAQALLEAIAHLRQRKMKLVFWNKEDPMHYDRFLPIARQADVILTTDAGKVADYRRDVPDAQIEVLPFAAQPRLCNPAERTRIEQEALCFAGSYYGAGHDERKQQMDALLPAIPEFGGAIYDRMSGIDGDRYRYPPQYQKFIRPAVPFSEMAKLY